MPTRDLQRLLMRAVRAEVLGGRDGALARRPPWLRVVRGPAGTLAGWYSASEHTITVCVAPDDHDGIVRATVLHEVVHAAGYGHHDRAFQRMLAQLAYEVEGFDLRHVIGRRCREVDRAVDHAIRWARRWRRIRRWARRVWRFVTR